MIGKPIPAGFGIESINQFRERQGARGVDGRAKEGSPSVSEMAIIAAKKTHWIETNLKMDKRERDPSSWS